MAFEKQIKIFKVIEQMFLYKWHEKKKIKRIKLEEKLNKDLENELMNHWKEFREIVLDDTEKPLKYKKIDVCQCIKSWLKTGKQKLPDKLELPSNDALKEQSERMWNNIVCYERHVQKNNPLPKGLLF
jgi:hypothetical protein